MSWTTAIQDLRDLLNDGADDRYRYRTRCFGEVNGTNAMFKTFDFRRVTNLTSATTPLGVFVMDATGVVAAATVSTDYPDTGEFVLSVAPAAGSTIEASFYVQYFKDDELDDYLSKASQWLGMGATYSNLDLGLQPSALQYAASEAYQRLAQRFREHYSQMYRVEDAPDPKTTESVTAYFDLSKGCRERALELRDEFYKRQGQYQAPLYGFALGQTRDVMPKG